MCKHKLQSGGDDREAFAGKDWNKDRDRDKVTQRSGQQMFVAMGSIALYDHRGSNIF